MRNSQKMEIAEVVREMLTHTNLLAEVAREVHTRLPETVRQYAAVALPELAAKAIHDAAPNPAALAERLRGDLIRVLDVDARNLVTRVADGVLPELAEKAVRAAAPDSAGVRAEVVAAATAELSVAIRAEIERALESVVARGSEQVRTAADEAVEKAAQPAARAVMQEVASGVDEIRADVVRQASDAVVETVRKVVDDTAGRAVQDAVEEIYGTLTSAVTTSANEVVPSLARDAVNEHVRNTATAAVERETAKAIPAVTDAAVLDVMRRVRESVEHEQQQACAAVAHTVSVAVDAKLAKFTPNVVQVVLPARGKVELAADAHEALPELLVALHARCHVLLVGPAGTGKSMLAKHAAEALELQFQALSLGPTTPMSKVFGYYDAHGNYHDTPFRRAFEHGGVMLLDELDNGHPGLLAELNQALALGTCAFADKMVDAHADFRLVATGNTYGTGADRQYVGRQTLDSATLDRFVVIDVPIDEGLEERIALRYAPSHQDEAQDLLTRIRKLRRTAATKNLPVILSPRASIDGAKLLEAGATVDQVMQWRVIRGLSAAHIRALGLE